MLFPSVERSVINRVCCNIDLRNIKCEQNTHAACSFAVRLCGGMVLGRNSLAGPSWARFLSMCLPSTSLQLGPVMGCLRAEGSPLVHAGWRFEWLYITSVPSVSPKCFYVPNTASVLWLSFVRQSKYSMKWLIKRHLIRQYWLKWASIKLLLWKAFDELALNDVSRTKLHVHEKCYWQKL